MTRNYNDGEQWTEFFSSFPLMHIIAHASCDVITKRALPVTRRRHQTQRCGAQLMLGRYETDDSFEVGWSIVFFIIVLVVVFKSSRLIGSYFLLPRLPRHTCFRVYTGLRSNYLHSCSSSSIKYRASYHILSAWATYGCYTPDHVVLYFFFVSGIPKSAGNHTFPAMLTQSGDPPKRWLLQLPQFKQSGKQTSIIVQSFSDRSTFTITLSKRISMTRIEKVAVTHPWQTLFW